MSEPIDPQEVAALDEATWYRMAYRGGERQLTARAIATGLAFGFVLSFANVYIGLRTGWFFTMALAACLASFATWRLLASVRIVKTPLGLLETNCMQSTASSAAYATGNMVVGVIPAMLLLSVSTEHPRGVQPSWIALAAWIACVGALGVTLAIPLKRQLINRERLPFPSGTAAAIMLHGLHRAHATARARTRWLFAAIVTGAVLPLVRDLRGLALIPGSSRIFDWLPRFRAGGTNNLPSEAGLVLDHSLLLVAAGVFVGLRTTVWMVIGGLVTAFGLGPHALDTGVGTRLDLAWAEVGIWIGAPLLVAYALVALAGNWRTIARTFTRHHATVDDALARQIEIPRSWFWIGLAICGTTATVLARVLFDIPIVLGVLAVALSVVFSMVACRITGETDITPGGPMGKLTQLVFGALHPSQPTTNLMTASLTHASSVAAADLLTDLKSGYLLGADPRRQFIAQAIGILAGTCASVLAYFVLIPDAAVLIAGDFAAPAAHQFRAIAELLQHGFSRLTPMHEALVIAGLVAGVVLSCLERLSPKRIARWTPSAAGLGLGLLLPVATSIAMFLGAAFATIAIRAQRDAAERFVWPISAGLLAGESLAGVAVAIANQLVA